MVFSPPARSSRSLTIRLTRAPRLVLGVVLARWLHAAAGNICSIMHWAIGFRELGWEVWIAEHLSSSELGPPESPGRASPQEEYWKAMVEEYGFHSCECLLIDGKSPQLEAFREFASSADLFINYAGHFKRLDLIGSRTVKAYLDVDPAFTQLWVEVSKSDMNLEGHDVFLTVGTTLNLPGALLPTLGRRVDPRFSARCGGLTGAKKLGAVPSVAADCPMDNDRALVRLPRAGMARTPVCREAREPRENEGSSAKHCAGHAQSPQTWRRIGTTTRRLRRQAGASSPPQRSARMCLPISASLRRAAERLASPRRDMSSRAEVG